MLPVDNVDTQDDEINLRDVCSVLVKVHSLSAEGGNEKTSMLAASGYDKPAMYFNRTSYLFVYV